MEFLITELENDDFPTESIPLEKADDYLNDLNLYLKEQNEMKVYRFELRYLSETTYKNSITLPLDKEPTILSILDKQIDGSEIEGKKQFIEFVRSEMDSPTDNAKEQTEPAKGNVQSTKKKPLGIIKIVLALLIVVTGAFLVWAQAKPNEQPKKPSYQALIKESNYLEAGKQYPKKRKAIEQEIYDSLLEKKTEKKVIQLEKFNEKYTTVFGTFDLAIFNKNYKQAVDCYEDQPESFEESDERIILVGYAYLKEEKLAESKRINKQIKSVELEKKIYEYEQLTRYIEEKEKELSELEKGGSKNRERAEQVATEKFELQEKLLNL